jgi:predicted ATPase
MSDEAQLDDTVSEPLPIFESPTFLKIELTNFLSYKHAELVLSNFTALVGPNASGKSNAVRAFRLLRDIPTYGLPVAIARHGGFDQLRHRSNGRPNDPAIRLTFQFDQAPESHYELALAAVAGKRYRVKQEHADIFYGNQGSYIGFESDGKRVVTFREGRDDLATVVAPGQSALSTGTMAGFIVYNALRSIQTIETNPALVASLQEPSSTEEFDPAGANTSSIYESMGTPERERVADRLSAIVPGIVRIEPRTFADQQTLAFVQDVGNGNREFLAKQMSDGTLRAFAIMLALSQTTKPRLLVIEEPEVAIHLGALQSLVEILEAESDSTQVLITTHSADIIDEIALESLRVVWSEVGRSNLAPISAHTVDVLRTGMISPGALLRADALDPEIAS